MPTRTKILLVDDEPEVRGLFKRVLTHAGYGVTECPDGADALEAVTRDAPALIVLDVEMPRQDGWKTLAQLRRSGCTQPILMITHVSDVDSRVQGLELGADDYLAKPCEPAELLARVRALLRRSSGIRQSTTTLRFGEVVIDLERKVATRADQPVRLTRTEFSLIAILAETPGRPVTREKLLERLWGASSGRSHTVDTHLWRLRKKLGNGAADLPWIKNLPGMGYVLEVSPGGAIRSS
jgi:two-component system, OmpR family, response regulator MprA